MHDSGPTASSYDDVLEGGLFDVDFEGAEDGWVASGWVPSIHPVTVVIMDGGQEICRGRAEVAFIHRRLPDRTSFRFWLPVRGDRVDYYYAYVAETGMAIPRRVDWDD